MFLATTALSDFWDKEQEILFLGTWCLRYDRRDDWKDLKYEVMPSLWDDRKRFYDAARYLDESGERILTRLADYLNAVHGVAHGVRYWRILIGPWLIHALHQIYDRYVHLAEAFKQHADLQTFCLAPESFRVPADATDSVELACEDEYNLQLFSLLLHEMGYRFPSRSLQGEWRRGLVRIRPTRLMRMQASAKNAMAHAAVLLGRIRGRNAWAALYDLGAESRSRRGLAWATKLSAVPSTVTAHMDPAWGEPVFDARRVELARLASSDEFERLFVRCLPHTLPGLYLEGYRFARTATLRSERTVPPVIVSGSDWYFNEGFKYLAAEGAERRSRLVAVQHGGGYGIFRFSAPELHESRVGDSFFTWGWTDGDHPQGCNVPSPRLSSLITRKVAGRQPGKVEDILFVTTAHPRYLYRFHSQPVGAQWNDYFDWERRFLSALPGRLRSMTIFRPYPHDYGHGVRDRTVSEFPEVRWDSGSALYELYRRARLAVVDHNATAYLETLAANVPTVMFWDPQRWEVREAAAGAFQRLRDVGVLLESPEAAAAKVAAVYDDVSGWWNSENVQRTRRQFVDRYALSRLDWREQWVKALDREIALSVAREPGTR